MTKLLKYIKGSAIIYAILAPLMMFVEVIMDLNQPKLMADIIDIGVANGDISYVLNSGFKMIVVAFIGILGGMLCGVFATLASMNMGKNMRQGLFDKIQIILSVTLITSKSIPFFTEMQKKIDNVNLVMRENLLGVRVIKAFDIENKVGQRFNDANKVF